MMGASSHPHHNRLPLSSGGRRRNRRAWQEEQEEEELKGQMPPPPLPPPALPPSVSVSFPVVPPSPFVLAEANPGLFTAVLSNWTWQECSDCRMVLAAPGVYPINEVRECVMGGERVLDWMYGIHSIGTVLTWKSIDRNNQEIHLLQGGRRLMLEASVDGVILQLLFPLTILGATLVLRRLVIDVRSFCMSPESWYRLHDGADGSVHTPSTSLVHAGRQPGLHTVGLPRHRGQHRGGLRHYLPAQYRGPLLSMPACYVVCFIHMYSPFQYITGQLRRRRLRPARVEFHRLWLHVRAQHVR